MTSTIASDFNDTAATGAAIESTEENSVFPVSFAQRRLWFLDKLEPNSALYNIPSPVRLEGLLDIAALQNALQAMVDRHEPFRTTFCTVDSEPMQSIAPSAILEIPVVDLSCLAKDEREQETMRIMEDDAKKPFSLARDLMLRTKLVRLSPTEHVLLLTMHHIASDGWSMEILFRELVVFYEAFASGQTASLPELPIQYADFASWQRDWMKGQTLDKQMGYWKKQLTGAPALLEFPLDHPRPAVQSFRGASVSFSLNQSLVDSLKILSREEGCTLFMTLFAAFQTLAARCTGQEDIVIGSPIANRNRAETENIIGCFVNTLVLRTDLSGDPTFRELLKRVKNTSLDAYANQDLPFEKLVEELQPAREQSYSPLFQIMFILQNTPDMKQEAGPLRWNFLDVENGMTKFDLSLTMTESATGLDGVLEYATDLYEAMTMERLTGHLETLIEGIVATPDEHISRLPLLSETERQQLLVEWNQTRMEYSSDACVQQLIERQAAQNPEVVAVRFEKQSLTYRQLNERANQLAHHLQSLGVAPETLVAICMERSLEMMIGLLGILKAGGAYVPLDPNYPKDRLAFVLEDSKASILLTQKSLLDGLPRVVGSGDATVCNPKVICLDAGHLTLERESISNPQCHATAQNLAYVLYTSGSTGKPKGVQISHQALVNFLESMQIAPGISSEDTLLAITTLSFDIAGLELWLPLISGAKVVIAKSETAMDGKQLAEKIEKCGATILQGTPATWRILLESGWKGNPQLKIFCGGEAWPEELARELLLRGKSVWNLYGPTETTVYSAISQVEPKQTPRISVPIANTQLHILDAHFQPVPIGVAGELHIGGDGLALGYLNRPELTAEKFIPDPFSKELEARLYKTGDLARYRADGQIEFLGRLDHQVKIRGFRIELGEIQSLISDHESVREAVVMAREDVPGDKRLVAYIALEKSHSSTIDELRAALKKKLPEYMIPSAFVTLDNFPLTPNGKVDRKQLPPPETNRSEKTLMAPRDSLEVQLVKLWEKIFNVEPIGIRDNFFELGGHSLLAVRLFADVEKITGKNLPMVTLFQAPTIESLAEILRQQGWEAPWSSLVPIKAGGSRPPFYCIHGVGGNILEYLDLAKYMDDDQPFYGLQAVGLDGKRPWIDNVEEMAAHYINEIQAFQPRGPYYLGGSSFGGLVAFEMAHQFQAKGESVALLAFFDTHAPGYPKSLPATTFWRTRLNRWKYRLSLHGGNLMAAEGAEKLTYIRKKILKWSRGQIIMMKRRRKERRERIEQSRLPKAILETQKAGLVAHESYESKKYLGSATLFRATGQLDGIETHRDLGWSEYIEGHLEIYDTPGHHGSIVRDPRAKVLAAQLKESLQKAQTASRSARIESATKSNFLPVQSSQSQEPVTV